MTESRFFSDFFTAIVNDPRIGPSHITVYMALLQYWKEHHYQTPVHVFSHDIMLLAKISARATYQKSIKELDNYGYLRYEQSYKRNQGSKVYITDHVTLSKVSDL